MQPVYAVQFEIRPDEAASNSAVWESAAGRILAWVTDWYSRRMSLDVDLSVNGSAKALPPSHTVEISSMKTTAGERIWKMVWTYPDERDDNLLWQSQALLAVAAGMLEFTFILRLTSRQFEVKRAVFKIRPPRIVRELVESFPCYLGPLRLSAKPFPLAAEDVREFVWKSLKSEDRRLPVLVVSPERATGVPLLDPSLLASRVMGLAEVVFLVDRWAGYALIDEVGKMYACYNGAARIYWPGFHTPRDPGLHFVYKQDRLIEARRTDHSIEDDIFDRLRLVAAMRVVEGPVTFSALAAVQDEARRNRDVELSALKTQLATGVTDRQRILEQFEKMRQERDDALDQVAKLQKELETQRQNWLEVQNYLMRKEDEAQPAPEVEEPEFPSVFAALRKASTDFGRKVECLETAWESAEESRYKNPETVYQAVEAVRELADAWFDKDKRGTIGPVEKFFRQRGFDFTAHESKTTMGKYSRQRTFPYEGGRIIMTMHLTLGGGSRENCLQVYFAPDESKGKFLIGHCGVHLDYAGQRT